MKQEPINEVFDRLKKVEELVRFGLLPIEHLSILKRALSRMQQGMFIPFDERKIFYGFISRLIDLALSDTTINRLIKQRAMSTKFEEKSIPDALEQVKAELAEKNMKKTAKNMLQYLYKKEDLDLKKTPEGMLDTLASVVKHKVSAGGKVSPEEKRLSSKAKSELRRRRNVAKKRRMSESNITYAQKMQLGMEKFGINNLAELPQEQVKEFFTFIDNIQNLQGE